MDMDMEIRILPRSPSSKQKQTSIIFSGITIIFAIVFGAFVLNPIWKNTAIPGLFPPYLQPPITAPVDGLYYLQNADTGYKWETRDPLSLWFHPFLSFVLWLIPNYVSSNYQFWIVSICFSFCALPLAYHFAIIISGKNSLSPWLLPMCLFAPGGLVISTGNAETPTLFFATILVMSVLVWQKWWLTSLSAVGTILTKPNGLYLIPVLLIYFLISLKEGKARLRNQALVGIFFLLITWISWIWFIDWRTGGHGVYWELRSQEHYYLGIGGNIFYFFGSLVDALTNTNIRDQVRYITALVIPLTNFFVIGFVPMEKEEHRFALAAGNLAMFAVSLYLGNPNKIIVYAVTLPSHFSTHMLMVSTLFDKMPKLNKKYIVVGLVYFLYCIATSVIFIVGTPLRWYH